MSRRKRVLFASITVCLPFAVLALLELALRLLGHGGYPAMLQRVGQVKEGTLVVADQAGALSWFFANPYRTGRNEQQSFLDPKPTNTTRIFLLGESAVQGYPQPRHLASSAFLQEMLTDAWPDRKVEVLNLGTTAVASFPVLGILTEALAFQPDLIVIYTGNNEFFGTYGVTSTSRAGSKPWMLKLTRLLHSLALTQGIKRLTQWRPTISDRTMMEAMMAETYVSPDSGLRRAAANNLHHNIDEMIRRCQARGVPVLVCTLPSNESGLAPIGSDRVESIPADTRRDIESALAAAESSVQQDSESAAGLLREILELRPDHARAHYLLGVISARQGTFAEARAQFVRAQDLDSMPWRPPSQLQAAVLAAARDHRVPVCDLLEAFRNESPNGIIGWELMDDHVHPNLRGQALIAESIVKALETFQGTLLVRPEVRQTLPPWTEYARRLGDNVYDRYAVAHQMRRLFDAEFMRRNNPDAFERFHALATSLEEGMSPEIRAAMEEWQTTRPFAGSRCPATAAAAQVHLKRNEYGAALELLAIARRNVPEYTSWHLEYSYYWLLCRKRLHGDFAPADRMEARHAIDQGHFLARRPHDDGEFVERYTGMLHLLCDEYAEAIPYLNVSRKKLTGLDRLSVDQALVVSYLKTGQTDRARELLTTGARSGEFANNYKAILDALPALEAEAAAGRN